MDSWATLQQPVLPAPPPGICSSQIRNKCHHRGLNSKIWMPLFIGSRASSSHYHTGKQSLYSSPFGLALSLPDEVQVSTPVGPVSPSSSLPNRIVLGKNGYLHN